MRLALTAVAFATVLAGAGAAQTFTAENQLKVVPLNGSDFEVIEARGEGPRGMWCAAADYAVSQGRTGPGQRIYVKTPRGPSVSVAGRKGVVFTTDESRLSQPPSRSLSVGTRTVGEGLPLVHAFQFCRDYQIELGDILFLRKGNL